ncbi:MAG: Mrp/NBP35 family ATP-binding protein [Humidesulfovibrio sp.]|nr:Mrp/NBP35 family ATP-binding protein [Humidesulfovibrio sp.]
MAKQDQRIVKALERIRYKLFVMSGKGGVGKSSISVNIAAALAARGYKVGLMDVDIHGPSVPRLLGITGQLEIGSNTEIFPKRYNDNLHVVSMESLLLDPDQAVLWRGPMKTSAIRQFISDVQWGELDFLVVDSPPGTGDEPMTVLKLIPEALAVVVTTPQEVSLADVRKAINFLQYAQANILGVVENMSGLACPHCGKSIDLFKKGGGKDLAEHYGLEFLGAIPLDPATVVAGDLGTPVVLLDAASPAKEALLALGDRVARAAQNSLEAASTVHR